MIDNHNDLVRRLVDLRAESALHGHDITPIAIGHWNGLTRICDDNGCYDFHTSATTGRIIACCYGCPSMTIVHIATMAERDCLACYA